MKPGPKPKKDRIIPRSIAANADEWRWCIGESLRRGITVSALIRELIRNERKK